MFSRIVVGIDGTPAGEDAVAFARSLSGPDTTLVLVNAFPYEQHASRASVGGFEELLREQSVEMLAKAAGDSGAERRAIADVSPGRALQRVAESEHADLIVVGSCRYGTVTRVLLGDVSRAVLHGATCAVAVVPRDWRESPQRITRIGVGFTRTPEARAALELAAEMAREHNCTLRVRTSVSVPVSFAPAYAYTYDWDAIEAEHRTMAQQDLDEAVAGLTMPVVTETTTGSPAGDLAELSEKVDLLVVGSRGWGTAHRVVLGSTSDRVTHHAACPVLVVPAHTNDRATEREEAVHA